MTISSSLNASVAGLAANASRLATISDNIANSATYGYRRVQADFHSMVIASTGGTYSAGGVRTTTQRLIDQGGALTSTANPTDLAVRGRGFLPARNGELSQRFELRNGDCTVRRIPGSNHPHDWGCNYDRERAEVMHTQWRPGRDKWIGFSVRIDDDWTVAKNNHCTGIFQIKQTENNVYQGNLTPKDGKFAQSQEEVERFGGHYIGGPNVMDGDICGNKFGISVTRSGFKDSKYNGWSKEDTTFYGRIDSIKNEWNDVILHWDTRDYRNGISKLIVYFNGQVVGVWENITGNFFPDIYTFKYGLYRGYMKANHGQNFKVGTQVVYFDEVRTGRSFDAVNPATNRALD